MAKVKLTCFADEISADLSEQLNVLEQEGLRHLELRNVWGKNVLSLNDEELLQIRQMLKERGFRISSIASPIGKYPVNEDFEPQLQALNTAIQAANYFETPYIRIFSYHPPANEPITAYREEVLNRLCRLAEIAEQNKVILILENDTNMYGSDDTGTLEIFSNCRYPSLRAAFDPGNYVICGVRPMTDAYPKVYASIDYVHVKDASIEPSQFVPAGVGAGEIPQLLAELKSRGFQGFLSVEPHLQHYLPNASNPERVVAAIRALKSQLDQSGQEWE
ncbi:sugar phosphate isomerase/epimerase family protein [Paenibacillus spongiae]|uniref:Sugar phosphate isomerase/epimerase n=1 Tax=Paenibacillus spongiae TaxID=2909671 RepID=A0ABY5SHC0_9BACL|nr:sugar phosphate isomerase/epimerase family protein [Paenibacillus spongiae]UVI33396.1 sugar phosphate isomerase/epimerase [Paenibacillus spongiae]